MTEISENLMKLNQLKLENKSKEALVEYHENKNNNSNENLSTNHEIIGYTNELDKGICASSFFASLNLKLCII